MRCNITYNDVKLGEKLSIKYTKAKKGGWVPGMAISRGFQDSPQPLKLGSLSHRFTAPHGPACFVAARQPLHSTQTRQSNAIIHWGAPWGWCRQVCATPLLTLGKKSVKWLSGTMEAEFGRTP